MMTREEVAEIMTYCQEHTVSYKDRLAELGIAPWRFYDAKPDMLNNSKHITLKCTAWMTMLRNHMWFTGGLHRVYPICDNLYNLFYAQFH